MSDLQQSPVSGFCPELQQPAATFPGRLWAVLCVGVS